MSNLTPLWYDLWGCLADLTPHLPFQVAALICVLACPLMVTTMFWLFQVIIFGWVLWSWPPWYAFASNLLIHLCVWQCEWNQLHCVASSFACPLVILTFEVFSIVSEQLRFSGWVAEGYTVVKPLLFRWNTFFEGMDNDTVVHIFYFCHHLLKFVKVNTCKVLTVLLHVEEVCVSLGEWSWQLHLSFVCCQLLCHLLELVFKVFHAVRGWQRFVGRGTTGNIVARIVYVVRNTLWLCSCDCVVVCVVKLYYLLPSLSASFDTIVISLTLQSIVPPDLRAFALATPFPWLAVMFGEIFAPVALGLLLLASQDFVPYVV